MLMASNRPAGNSVTAPRDCLFRPGPCVRCRPLGNQQQLLRARNATRKPEPQRRPERKKILTTQNAKNAKQIVAVSYYGRTTQRATLSHKDPKRNTRAWILMHNVLTEVTYATHRSGDVTRLARFDQLVYGYFTISKRSRRLCDLIHSRPNSIVTSSDQVSEREKHFHYRKQFC